MGDLTQRLELKKRLQCKPFSWFLENIWPELFVYNKDVIAWGSVSSLYQAQQYLADCSVLLTHQQLFITAGWSGVKSVTSCFDRHVLFLAHLSQWLIGELIV